MNREDTAKILHVLKTNYPQSFKEWDADRMNEFLDLWTEAFKNTPASLVTEAVKKIIYNDTREFAPNIGQVNAKIKEMLTANSEAEAIKAWETVTAFIRKYGVGNLYEHYKELPEIVRRIYSVDSLGNIGRNDAVKNEMIMKPQFIKLYKQMKEQADAEAFSSGALLLKADNQKQIEGGKTDDAEKI